MGCARLEAILSKWRVDGVVTDQKALPRLGHGQMGLAKNRPKRTLVQSLAMKGHGDPDHGIARVFEVVAASSGESRRVARCRGRGCRG